MRSLRFPHRLLITRASNRYIAQFIATEIFIGSKDGYVFQNGPLGVGYYIDTYSRNKIQQPFERQDGSPENHSRVTYHPFPYEYRQTKAGLSILCQVPKIDVSSVTIQYFGKEIRLRFRSVTAPESLRPSRSEGRAKEVDSVSSSNRKDSDTILDQNEHIDASRITSDGNESSVFHYGLCFLTKEEVDEKKSQFDVASLNMVLVLVKKIEVYWL